MNDGELCLHDRVGAPKRRCAGEKGGTTRSAVAPEPTERWEKDLDGSIDVGIAGETLHEVRLPRPAAPSKE